MSFKKKREDGKRKENKSIIIHTKDGRRQMGAALLKNGVVFKETEVFKSFNIRNIMLMIKNKNNKYTILIPLHK